jgi:hypothetical protein
MALAKPYHRNYREIIEKPNSGYSGWAYIVDKDYAISPHHYTRAFLLIQESIIDLFKYIEPADVNLKTFSFKNYELLIQVCMEVEANFKAILTENIYNPVSKKGEVREEKDWNINDYKKINRTHHLDEYIVEFPIWRGKYNKYTPFENWKNKPLPWYKAYNDVKHNRVEKFELASFENLLAAFAGLFVLLSSQFRDVAFAPGTSVFAMETDDYFGLGDYLKITYPKNWTEEEKYDFDWSILKAENNKFAKIDYNKI